MEDLLESPQTYDNPIVSAGYELQHRVHVFRERVRELYFAAMLFLKPCPQCGAADLSMLRDSWCRCASCGTEFDATITFLTCTDCGTGLRIRRTHYWCPKCRQSANSPFCFDARVFDKAYFREMVRESRQRKRERREAVRLMLAGARSSTFHSDSEPHLGDIPDLSPALDAFVGEALPAELVARFVQRPEFNLQRYRDHILGLINGCLIHFEGVMPLISDRRLDRIFRFITLIFLQHEGRISLTQTDGGEILIEEHEAH